METLTYVVQRNRTINFFPTFLNVNIQNSTKS